jgi:hypothetical protein
MLKLSVAMLPSKLPLQAVLRIRDILVPTDPDPYLLLTDPDRDFAIFVSDLQDGN